MTEDLDNSTDSATGAAPEADRRPVLRIVNADATPEEIAAIVAVLGALQSTPAPPPRRRPEWSAHHRKVRTTHPHGPGGWRSSALPS
ncbi:MULTISPECIES: acyl-CoA carboxylase subunit epsilon [unclassified Nocardioides]|uniref:acyl-CoA carboxylase subunit epsilon n=1 Tax=unclassified Nocardioides TaxID=2615069 RepID=UPI0009F0021C|nr:MULTISPECIES: acyl-CoA carboxylase subunit epsilon [unclassified Nocardioides]GAW50783.1 uncharacterized protein PD653B2_3119 [Nocardioides sp. PD653-B2]GAW52722.1 uncharacterized protein PD653_0115 [Nocardioides sp. PD653]